LNKIQIPYHSYNEIAMMKSKVCNRVSKKTCCWVN